MASSFGGNVKLKGESEYKNALKDITNNLKILASEMTVVNSQYDKNDKSITGLRNENERLNKQLDGQVQKILGIKQALSNAEKGYGANSQQVTKWQVELNKAEAELNDLNRELSKNTEELKKSENALEDNNDELKDFEKNEKNAGNGAIKFGDLLKANILSDFIVDGIRKLGSSMAELAGKFFEFVKGGVENASNLQEVQNVVDTVFGESANKIEEFSKKASTQFGMTELSVKNFAGSMGAMLDSMGVSDDEVADMSLSLVGLAGDMASFYNLEHDEVWAKIRSGISGETEPLKQLGINMSVANLEAYALSQGIETSYKEMTQAEQVQLRYNYLMEQTANAQGDFAKTSDSFANQQKILSMQFENLATSIGTFLLPTLNEALNVFNQMMSGEVSLEQGVGQITQIVVNLLNSIVEKLPEIQNAGITILNTLLQGLTDALPKLLPAVSQIISNFLTFIVQSLPLIIDAGVKIILSLVQGIVKSLPTLIPAIVDAVITIATNLIDNVDMIIDAGIELILGLSQGLISAIPVLVSKIPEIITSIVSALLRNIPKLITTGIQLIVQMGIGMVSAIPQIVAMLPQIILGMINGLKQGVSQFFNIGIDMIKGLWQGMWSWAGNLFDGIKDIGKNIVNGFKRVFHINSPSKIFADEIGKNLALGLGVGFEDTMSDVSKDMANSVPTDFNVETNYTSGTTAEKGLNFDVLVEAFTEALKGIKVVMDGDEMGEFVTNTVERVVYS